MTDTIIMEELSKNYLLTLAAGSGYMHSNVSHDYGTDLTIRKANFALGRTRMFISGKSVDIQVKAVSEKYVIGLNDLTTSFIKYDLEIKNYQDLIDRANERGSIIPLVLCIFIIPDDQKDWYSVTPTELTIRKCAFWYNVPPGLTYPKNKASIRIEIPKINLVCSQFYNNIFTSLF